MDIRLPISCRLLPQWLRRTPADWVTVKPGQASWGGQRRLKCHCTREGPVSGGTQHLYASGTSRSREGFATRIVLEMAVPHHPPWPRPPTWSSRSSSPFGVAVRSPVPVSLGEETLLSSFCFGSPGSGSGHEVGVSEPLCLRPGGWHVPLLLPA